MVEYTFFKYYASSWPSKLKKLLHTLHSIFLIPEGGTSQEQFAKVLGDIKLQIHHKQLSITFFTFGEGGNASFIDNYKT